MKSHELRPEPLQRVSGKADGQAQGSAFDARVDRNSHPGLAFERPVVVINSRRLFSQSILISLRITDPASVYENYGTMEDWQSQSKGALADLVILCIADNEAQRADQSELRRLLQSVRAIDPKMLAVVIAERESPDRIVEALDLGARGYIPTSTPFEIAARALKLVRAGGIYVPASFVDVLVRSWTPATIELFDGRSVSFSTSQLRVAHALGKGLSNKMIAQDLALGESTVRNHVRNIVKQLNATSRTEAARLAKLLLASDEDDTSAAGST